MYQLFDSIIILFIVITLSIFNVTKACAYTYNPNTSTNFTSNLILEQNLQETISTPAAGVLFYVVSDTEENFYLPTPKGFNYYSGSGNILKSVELDYSKYRNNTNLVLVDNKIIYVSKHPPGYINVFDSESGDVLNNIQILQEHEIPLNTNLIDFSNITASEDGNYVFFTSNYPAKIYRLSVNNLELDFLDVPSNYGAWYTAPVLVDSSKVLFTSHKGILQLFDQNNISTEIFAKSFNNNFNFLYKINSASRVPTSYNELSFFTLYQKYICNYEKVGGTNSTCIEFLNAQEKESLASTNIVADSSGTYFIINKNQNGSNFNYLTFYNNNLDRVWEARLNKADIGGVIQDSNNIITSGNSIEYINKQSGKVLGSFDITNTHNSVGVLRTSLVSPTNKGNFYVFAKLYDYKNKKELPTIYKFKGEDTTNNNCELGFYCQSTPKHRPVILIHGLGGNYKSWFDQKNAVVRNTILQQYKKDDPEFPNSWIHAYSYGYKFDGTYNYQGKIQDISTNLHFDIERLARQHKQAGGDGRVDLIGYSLGGLVARHYILEKTGFPGNQNLDVDHKVGKLILVASPVNGSSGFQVFDDIEKDYPEIGKELKDGLNKTLSTMQNQPIDLYKDVGLQIGSESSYLNAVRVYNHPQDIYYFRSYANFKIVPYINLFGVGVKKEISLGDLTVLPNDTTLPVEFSSSKLEERVYSTEVSVEGGKIVTNFDTLDFLDLYHARFIDSQQNISNLLSFLSYE